MINNNNKKKDNSKNKMKNITINLPETYVDLLDNFSTEKGTSRSELIRRAIADLLKTDIPFLHEIDNLYPHLALERKQKLALQEWKKQKQEIFLKLGLEKQKILEFYNYCIICDRRLHNSRIPKLSKSQINIYELRFCCSCFSKQNSSNQMSSLLVAKIQKKLSQYNDLKEELKDNEEFKDLI